MTELFPTGKPHLLNELSVDRLIDQWLAEDIPSFDYGGTYLLQINRQTIVKGFVVGYKRNQAHLFCKSAGVLAGVPFVNRIFQRLQCSIEWQIEEGQWCEGSEKDRVLVATVEGPAYLLLQGERTALNLLARCSGIATLARRLQTLKQNVGWNGLVAGTRKTTPGFRLVEKYGMLVGGADTHRMDLSSMVMLKDNHVWSCGSVALAVERARVVAGFSLKIEVECRSANEAWEAAQSGADVIMLDHFSPEDAAALGKKLKLKYPQLLVELSGGFTEQNIAPAMLDGIDVISMGSMTQGYQIVDFSLKIQPQ